MTVRPRFFAPFDPLCPPSIAPQGGFNASIQDDGALASLAETAAWRLGAQRAMVRLVLPRYEDELFAEEVVAWSTVIPNTS